MSPAIWSYSESSDLANEAASAASAVRGSPSQDSVAIDIGTPRAGVRGTGGKLVLLGPDQNGGPEVAAEALARAFKEKKPSLIVIAATRNGRETAARVAAKAKIPCLSDATSLSLNEGAVIAERSVFSGRVVSTLSAPLPAVVTVKAGAFKPLESGSTSATELQVGEVDRTSRVKGRKEKEASAVDLRKARVIVSAGRGVKKKEDLPMLEELAAAMGGTLGCSRPLSSDLGWLPEERHIGLTGVTVRPDLYVALGISGQLQHIAGMKDSKVVVAVNTDKDAPIFQSTDYGIVGDLYQVVPAIKKLLMEREKP